MRIEISEDFAPPGGRTPARPLIAVGDVHGYSAPLGALLAHLAEHIDDTYGAEPVDLVFLGDYVDRGPDPLGVFDLLRKGIGLPSVAQTNLMGNHDWFLAEAAGLLGVAPDPGLWPTWLQNGGVETLEGLGLPGDDSAEPDQIREALGTENVALLEGLGYSFHSGEVLCVHAGLDPRTPLDRQSKRDLLWIREPFLSWDSDPLERWELPVTVIHGHSPHANGVFAHRIGVDTGGFSTGIFSAVELTPDIGRFHRVITDWARI